METRLIGCAGCPVRGVRCDGCLVTAMAGIPLHIAEPRQEPGGGPPGHAVASPGGPVPVEVTYPLTAAEVATVGRFVAAGLVLPDDASGLRARRVRPAWDAATG